ERTRILSETRMPRTQNGQRGKWPGRAEHAGEVRPRPLSADRQEGRPGPRRRAWRWGLCGAGQKGGAGVLERHGLLFYSQIGQKGGKALKARADSNYYSRIGKLGGTAPRHSKRRNTALPQDA